ncbi:SMI1/KNR4 family protein [Budvicia aquatica]|uniref:SMI1/KNR4 family protein n=1 Tax=Budvicia aquatica TaxID=82979 RepID=UPI00208B5778|nr:SMI1/KNR4 family protein [Budvicia aquatica]GKX52713.1 hypothetical protein SOASR029_30220 [Budvicia aquatica]
MSVAKLKNKLSFPDFPNENHDVIDWPCIDNSVKFPDDYIEFIHNYGTGRIANFLVIFNPFAGNDEVNFFKQKDLILEDLKLLKEEDPDYYRYKLYPVSEGILPIGVTDNGDYIFWVMSDIKDSNRWNTAIIASRSPDIEFFNESVTSLIEGLLSKRIKSTSLPDRFPTEPIDFSVIR